MTLTLSEEPGNPERDITGLDLFRAAAIKAVRVAEYLAAGYYAYEAADRAEAAGEIAVSDGLRAEAYYFRAAAAERREEAADWKRIADNAPDGGGYRNNPADFRLHIPSRTETANPPLPLPGLSPGGTAAGFPLPSR